MATEADLIERLIIAINSGLGVSWAYSNYGGDELKDCRDQLTEAAKAALAVMQDSAEWQAIEGLTDRLDRIRAWCDAYPIEVFPDQDLEKANTVLAEAGISMSAMHGQWARHIMSGIASIAGKAKASV